MALPAWAAEMWTTVQPYAERAAVWRGYERELQTLAIYGIGIAVYTALVFAFYQSLSRRRPIALPGGEHKDWRGKLSRFVGAALIFPVLSFLYFAVLALALFVLAKSQSTQDILLIAMAVVVGVRVTVYLSEKMSNDLSKLVPLSLLAVLLVDPGYITLELAWTRFAEATWLKGLLGRYFLLFIALEAVLSLARLGIVTAHTKYAKLRGAPAKKPDASFSVEVKESAPARPPKTG